MNAVTNLRCKKSLQDDHLHPPVPSGEPIKQQQWNVKLVINNSCLTLKKKKRRKGLNLLALCFRNPLASNPSPISEKTFIWSLPLKDCYLEVMKSKKKKEEEEIIQM